MFENYYCAQLRFNAPQRSSINPNLTCIWSQFGRGNRPRTEGTACVRAQKRRLRIHIRGLFWLPDSLHAELAGLFRGRVRIFTQFVLRPPPFWPSPAQFSALLREQAFYKAEPLDFSPGTAYGPQEKGHVPRPRVRRLGLGWGILPACKIQEGDEKLTHQDKYHLMHIFFEKSELMLPPPNPRGTKEKNFK